MSGDDDMRLRPDHPSGSTGPAAPDDSHNAAGRAPQARTVHSKAQTKTMINIRHPHRHVAAPLAGACLWLAASAAPPAMAVSPLVTDDADTVPPGEFELVTGGIASRTDAQRDYAAMLGLTAGLTDQLELGVDAAWLWSRADGTTVDGFGDLFITPKWKHTDAEDAAFIGALFATVSLPTGSSSRGLGTGSVDLTAGVIGTWVADTTEIDLNLAYTAAGNLRFSSADDSIFTGAAVRHELPWGTVAVAEVYADIPASGFSGSAVTLQAGVQQPLGDNLFLDLAFGNGLGSHSDFRQLYLALRAEF